MQKQPSDMYILDLILIQFILKTLFIFTPLYLANPFSWNLKINLGHVSPSILFFYDAKYSVLTFCPLPRLLPPPPTVPSPLTPHPSTFQPLHHGSPGHAVWTAAVPSSFLLTFLPPPDWSLTSRVPWSVHFLIIKPSPVSSIPLSQVTYSPEILGG